MRMLDRGRALVVALGVAGVVAAMGVTASPAGAAPKAARPYDFDGRQRLSRSSDWGTSFTGRLRAAGWWRRGLAKVVGPGPHQVPRPLWIAHLTLNHLHEAGGIWIARDILVHVGADIKRHLTVEQLLGRGPPRALFRSVAVASATARRATSASRSGPSADR